MAMLEWAKNELELAGYRADDTEEGPNKWMREGVLRLLEVFCEEGHSGSSAPYAIALFQRLASWKPLTPLTGADDEWNEIADGEFQSRRASNVFKDKDGAYWSEGVVFWEWFSDPETGEKYKSYFTSRRSRVAITFPFTVPDEPEYREAQREEGTW